MKIEQTQVTKLVISQVKALDPITVYAEDIAPRKGKITIECYGKSWSAYWGGMGDQTVSQFVTSMNADYIANCLHRGIESSKYDASDAPNVLKAQLINRRRQASNWLSRRDHNIELIENKDEARELWERIENETFFDDPGVNAKFFSDFYGEEWWYSIPTSPNPDYQYLCRIIRAVQEALSSLNEKVEA